MSNAPVTTITDELLAELEQLAVSIKGWNMPHAFQEPEEGFLPQDWGWHIGQLDEDENQYPVMHVNAHQYDSEDSEKLARYYAACNRDTILALLQRVRELSVDAERYRWVIENADMMHWENMLHFADLYDAESVGHFIDAARSSTS